MCNGRPDRGDWLGEVTVKAGTNRGQVEVSPGTDTTRMKCLDPKREADLLLDDISLRLRTPMGLSPEDTQSLSFLHQFLDL